MPPQAGSAQRAGGGGGTSSPAQLNKAQRFAVLQNAIEMTQQIFTTLIAAPGAAPAPLNIVPRNVGLLKKFIVVISGTMNNTDGANAANLSDLGLANLLSQVVFTDLNNNVRIQTAGWHISKLYKARFRFGQAEAILGASVQEEDTPGLWNVINAPTGVAHGANAPFQMVYEIPIAYSDDDLRGAIYMNVVNAVANLQLQINGTPFAAAGVDSTLAVWKGAAGNISNVTVTVYQVFLDQLPVGKQGPILPVLDLSTVYELKNTSFAAVVAGQDFPIPYANFRDFLSTFLIYNNNAAADAGRTPGTDMNYLALQSANFTNIFKYAPVLAALKARQLTWQDLPNGMYYFSSRRKPFSTTTYGNLELIFNPSVAAATAYALVGWEDFALVNALATAGSLAG